jgi:hypothetical protein
VGESLSYAEAIGRFKEFLQCQGLPGDRIVEAVYPRAQSAGCHDIDVHGLARLTDRKSLRCGTQVAKRRRFKGGTAPGSCCLRPPEW